MIDLDNVKSYPDFIFEIEKKYHYSLIKYDTRMERLEISDDYSLFEKIIDKYCECFKNSELTGWHITRLLDINTIKENGLIKSDLEYSEKRIREIAKRLCINDYYTDSLIEQCKYYWRIHKSRVGTIHFTSIKIPNEEYLKFAYILGGEIVGFSLDDLKVTGKYCTQYNKFEIEGTPCAIKFKYNFNNLLGGNDFILEFLKTAYIKNTRNEIYLPKFDNYMDCSVPKDSILKIDDISNLL